VNTSGLTTALNTLDSDVNGLTGDTVGTASTTVVNDINNLQTQYTTLKTTTGCQ
jgi:hypothetical protein